MSSFGARGKRKSTIVQKKQAKKHIKRFYKSLHQLDLVAKAMVKSGVPITAENVEVEAAKYTDRPMEKMEQNILLSKVQEVYDKLDIKVNDDVK